MCGINGRIFRWVLGLLAVLTVSVTACPSLGEASRPSLDLLRAEVAADPSNGRKLYELGAAYYRKGDFQHFFAVAQWVRIKETSTLTPLQKDRWVALELMGLAHMCRWEDTLRLSRSDWCGPLARKALSMIQLKKEFKRFRSDPKHRERSLLKRWEESENAWRLTANEYARFANPIALTVKMRSECESR